MSSMNVSYKFGVNVPPSNVAIRLPLAIENTPKKAKPEVPLLIPYATAKRVLSGETAIERASWSPKGTLSKYFLDGASKGARDRGFSGNFSSKRFSSLQPLLSR